ncbi:MAG: Gx transporter family protein [Chitinispirillales bacterium]|jgi:heptaprenyl diphosphate synthase|nr:Gx transporter family protein [Chitinispirillales bacterium]
MESLTKQETNAAAQKAVWLLIAVAINALELAVPRLPFLPWLKPGFANIITILWIIRFGFKDALLYTTLRIWISGFYFGFSLFTFSLSLAGGILSTTVMSLLWITLGKRKLMGTVGLAIMGALFHNAGQLSVVYFMMAQNMRLFSQLPFMFGAAVIFGGVAGALVPHAARIIDVDYGRSERISSSFNSTNQKTAFGDKVIVTFTFLACVSFVFVSNFPVLTISAAVFSLTAFILNPEKPNIILYPLKFYILFLFIACTHLLFSYGTRVEALPFITYEGLSAFIKQSLRLWCWLQAAHILKRFHFHQLLFSALNKIFPDKSSTLEAGMIALEHFPEIVRNVRSREKTPITKLLLKPKATLTLYVEEMKLGIANIIENNYDKTETIP